MERVLHRYLPETQFLRDLSKSNVFQSKVIPGSNLYNLAFHVDIMKSNVFGNTDRQLMG